MISSEIYPINAGAIYRVTAINLLHDPFRPSDGIGNGCHSCRHPCSTVVLSEFPSREDARGNQKHALATFVHLGSLALSPYIRHRL